jgi:hypothetical protein
MQTPEADGSVQQEGFARIAEATGFVDAFAKEEAKEDRAAAEADRPSTGRTSSFGWSLNHELSSARSSDGADTPNTAIMRAGALRDAKPSEKARISPAPEPVQEDIELSIDRVVMSSLRMLAHHAGLQVAEIKEAYRTCLHEGRDAFAGFFCQQFAAGLAPPMDDPQHIARVYLPEGFPTRAERRFRLMALHSRMHITEVEQSLEGCADRDSRSRDADLTVFSHFVSENATRLPPEFPPLQELLELLP